MANLHPGYPNAKLLGEQNRVWDMGFSEHYFQELLPFRSLAKTSLKELNFASKLVGLHLPDTSDHLASAVVQITNRKFESNSEIDLNLQYAMGLTNLNQYPSSRPVTLLKVLSIVTLICSISRDIRVFLQQFCACCNLYY